LGKNKFSNRRDHRECADDAENIKKLCVLCASFASSAVKKTSVFKHQDVIPMKNLKLGTQLNISFALVLFVPMIVATLFSIRYYSNKIQEEAVNTISSDLKTADIIYQNSIMDMKHLATAYAQKKVVTVLLSLDLGEKLGNDRAKSAQLDDLDMITVVDRSRKVLVRSHAPQKTGDILPQRNHILKAFSGSSISNTEVLNEKDLAQEGFTGQPREGNILTMTGVAPVYDRQREHIIGAIVVRRVLNSESEVIRRICENLNISAALFEHVSLIASCTASKEEREFIPPPLGLLRRVLAQNTSVHIAEIQKRGSISNYQPIQGFSEDPVGILMVQTGVESYLLTRQTAINNLIIIFLVGVILAFTIKTIFTPLAPFSVRSKW